VGQGASFFHRAGDRGARSPAPRPRLTAAPPPSRAERSFDASPIPSLSPSLPPGLRHRVEGDRPQDGRDMRAEEDLRRLPELDGRSGEEREERGKKKRRRRRAQCRPRCARVEEELLPAPLLKTCLPCLSVCLRERGSSACEGGRRRRTAEGRVRRRRRKTPRGLSFRSAPGRRPKCVSLSPTRTHTSTQRTFREIMFLQELADHPNIIR